MRTYSRLSKEGRYANALCPTDFNFSHVKTLQGKGKKAKVSVNIATWHRKQTSLPFCSGPLASLKMITF